MLRKEAEAVREELEDKQKLLRGEQSDYRGQLEHLLECFNDHVELFHNESAPTVHSDIHTPNPSQGSLMGGTMGTPVKLTNPPSLPLFPGQTLHPKMKLTISNGYSKLGGTEFSYIRGSAIRNHLIGNR